ncbi:gentisate 1,2-dioxygenase [Arenibaculum sp.]|jgi:gentisate 1,2-dioxygenase|uniref:gentisate 1,2-dioxygenase n=1 Tax=Arenibaculum sp. TaxID=2865862 RepID=UPI002E1189E2|nr:gentisate 1,2-dioxygenase [Arenibaculum sp.]
MRSAAPAGPERAAFYERISPGNLAPLWESLHALVTPQPVSPVEACLWRYAEVREHLMEAGRLITAQEAERRVLILENPGLRGQAAITRSLYAGLQLILPGEVAPAHRHTQSALRFVVEGEGAHTAVEGERTVMRPGDLVLTPSWTWHDHGNESDRPMVWLDGLDIPLVRMLDASFAEKLNAEEQPVSRPVGDAPARYGKGLLPVDWKPRSQTSPVFSYPYERTREVLETLRRTEEWDPCHGLKMRYANPATGGHAMPTIGTFVQLLPKGFATEPYRCTDATVYAVVEGTGRTRVGDRVLDWGPKDVFVVPSWAPHRHDAQEEAVLFSYSDRPVQEKLDLWREARG